MPANIFISFDHDDAAQVAGFKGLINNPNHPLDCHDHSLPEAVRDRSGNVIKCPPHEPRAEPVHKEILRRFEACSRLVVLIGDNTHSSLWVEWEIKEFFKLKLPVSGDNTWKRIRGMRLKERRGGDPSALQGRAATTLEWDPAALDRWLDTPI